MRLVAIDQSTDFGAKSRGRKGIENTGCEAGRKHADFTVTGARTSMSLKLSLRNPQPNILTSACLFQTPWLIKEPSRQPWVARRVHSSWPWRRVNATRNGRALGLGVSSLARARMANHLFRGKIEHHGKVPYHAPQKRAP